MKEQKRISIVQKIANDDIDKHWQKIADDMLERGYNIDISNNEMSVEFHTYAGDFADKYEQTAKIQLNVDEYMRLLCAYEDALWSHEDDIRQHFYNEYEKACDWRDAKQDALRQAMGEKA